MPRMYVVVSVSVPEDVCMRHNSTEGWDPVSVRGMSSAFFKLLNWRLLKLMREQQACGSPQSSSSSSSGPPIFFYPQSFTPKLNVLSLWNICKRHCSDHRQNSSADNGSRTTGNGTHIHTQSHTQSHTLSSRLKLVGFCHKSDSTENNNEVEVERKDEGADGRENMIWGSKFEESATKSARI